jgi:hypothetical protein
MLRRQKPWSNRLSGRSRRRVTRRGRRILALTSSPDGQWAGRSVGRWHRGRVVLLQAAGARDRADATIEGLRPSRLTGIRLFPGHAANAARLGRCPGSVDAGQDAPAATWGWEIGKLGLKRRRQTGMKIVKGHVRKEVEGTAALAPAFRAVGLLAEAEARITGTGRLMRLWFAGCGGQKRASCVPRLVTWNSNQTSASRERITLRGEDPPASRIGVFQRPRAERGLVFSLSKGRSSSGMKVGSGMFGGDGSRCRGHRGTGSAQGGLGVVGRALDPLTGSSFGCRVLSQSNGLHQCRYPLWGGGRGSGGQGRAYLQNRRILRARPREGRKARWDRRGRWWSTWCRWKRRSREGRGSPCGCGEGCGKRGKGGSSGASRTSASYEKVRKPPSPSMEAHA